MDLYCRHCHEPWDNDSLHEEAEARNGIDLMGNVTYQEVAADFRENGCAALTRAFGTQACADRKDGDGIVGALYDLLGDDMDGAASMLEDAEALGLFA